MSRSGCGEEVKNDNYLETEEFLSLAIRRKLWVSVGKSLRHLAQECHLLRQPAGERCLNLRVAEYADYALH